MTNEPLENKKHRILCVDDDKQILNAYCRCLRIYYEVSGFTNPEEALDKYVPNRYDVVISDGEMPQMNGITFLKELQKRYSSSIPAIMISGNYNLLEEAINTGLVKAVFAKPMTMSEVIQTIENILTKNI